MFLIYILSPFVYRFDTKEHHFNTGDLYHLHTNKDGEEIQYISSPDFKHIECIDITYIDPGNYSSHLVDQTSIIRNVFQDNQEEQEQEQERRPTREERKAELEDMYYLEVKKLAREMGIDYTRKAETITNILQQEYQ
jgi:hypothetical protein